MVARFCAQGSLTCLQPSTLCTHICTSSFAATLLAAKKQKAFRDFQAAKHNVLTEFTPFTMKNSSLPSASSSR